MKNATRQVLAVALLLGAASARAEDFAFTVPVQVVNLPANVETLTVVCAALAPSHLQSGSEFITNYENIGYASVQVAITGGGYRGDVVVRFNVKPGKDPRSARKYRCDGTFDGHERGAVAHYFNGGKQQPPVFPLAPGAPFSLSTDDVTLPR